MRTSRRARVFRSVRRRVTASLHRGRVRDSSKRSDWMIEIERFRFERKGFQGLRKSRNCRLALNLLAGDWLPLILGRLL